MQYFIAALPENDIDKSDYINAIDCFKIHVG